MLFGIHAWFDPYARLECTSRLEFSRNDRQRRSRLRSVEARTDSRETASRADDCVSLLRLCLYIRFVRRDTWPFPRIVRIIVISASVLGKREAICRPFILTVRAHSLNAMTATPDHEQTRSCRSESDPFTFLRTSCPVDHFESFLSVRSCSTYLCCTGQKAVLSFVFHSFERAIRFETNSRSRAIRVYVSVKSVTCISETISLHIWLREIMCILYIVVWTMRCTVYTKYTFVYRCRLRSIEKRQVLRKNANSMINRCHSINSFVNNRS